MKSKAEIKKILARGEVVMTGTGQVIRSEDDIPSAKELLGPDASAEEREAAIREARIRRDEAERDLADLDPHASTTAGAQTTVLGDSEAAQARREILGDEKTPNSTIDKVEVTEESGSRRKKAAAEETKETK